MAERASQNPTPKGRPSRARSSTSAPLSRRGAPSIASRKTQGWPSRRARARSFASVTGVMLGRRQAPPAPARKRLVDLPDLVVAQAELHRGGVLLDVGEARRLRDREHVAVAGEER